MGNWERIASLWFAQQTAGKQEQLRTFYYPQSTLFILKLNKSYLVNIYKKGGKNYVK